VGVVDDRREFPARSVVQRTHVAASNRGTV
jgi:hypothetical protein